MTPMEFIARIAILVPPPYFPLTRYHGVFAARSSWRPLVTPKPPPGAVLRRDKTKSCKPCKAGQEHPPRDAAPSPLPPPPPSPSPTSTPSPAAPTRTSASAAADDSAAITVKHWGRLLDGDLYASASRLSFAVLLRRTHGIDARMPDLRRQTSPHRHHHRPRRRQEDPPPPRPPRRAAATRPSPRPHRPRELRLPRRLMRDAEPTFGRRGGRLSRGSGFLWRRRPSPSLSDGDRRDNDSHQPGAPALRCLSPSARQASPSSSTRRASTTRRSVARLPSPRT